MQVRILGSAAGGGSPQWNCWCDVCRTVRGQAPGTRRRLQSSIGVRAGAGHPWLLVNASPDVHRQLELLDPQPAGDVVRHTPIGAVLLTDAEIDHASGLLLLRESTSALRLYATAQARAPLADEWPLLTMLEAWCGVDWHELHADQEGLVQSFGELAIEAFTTGQDPPRYQRGGGGPGTSIGVSFHAPGGGMVTYCPTIEAWTEPLEQRLRASDVALVDGTFWSDDELARHGAPSPRTAAQMGHLPLTGPDGTARRLAGLGTRIVLVHVNNSNPVLLEHGDERRELERLGIEVGFDGMVVEVSGG